jgi:hypothetical protein
MRLSTTAAVLLMLALAPTATAQEPRLGLTVAYPTGVGVIWRVSERLALRPEFTLGYSNEIDDQFANVRANAWRFGVALSGVVSIVRDGPRHLYAAPYYEFQRRYTTASQTVSYGDPDDFFATTRFALLEVKPRTNEHSIGGIVGFEFRIKDRYGLFVEGGAAHRNSRRSATMPEVPANSSPVAFTEESLNRTFTDTRGIGRAGFSVYF